jgi:hypothetical protein
VVKTLCGPETLKKRLFKREAKMENGSNPDPKIHSEKEIDQSQKGTDRLALRKIFN